MPIEEPKREFDLSKFNLPPGVVASEAPTPVPVVVDTPTVPVSLPAQEVASKQEFDLSKFNLTPAPSPVESVSAPKQEFDLSKFGLPPTPPSGEEAAPERSFAGEVGAGLVRGGLGIAKLVPQVGKIVGSDILGPVVKGITGTDLAKEAFTPMIKGLEGIATSKEWKPSAEAGGVPIDLDRIISNPGEVLGQIGSQITNPRFWAAQLPEGAMSMIPAIVGAWAPRAVALGGKLGTALEAAKAAGDTVKVAEIGKRINRLGTIGMYGMSMAMEAGQGEEKVRAYDEAHPDKPVSWGARVVSILGTGVVAGGLEAFSLGKVLGGGMLGRVPVESVEAATIKNILNGKGGQEIVKKVLEGVATEGLTEGAQSIVENAFPRGFFDKNQKLLEGVVESMLIGAALGGLGGGAGGIAQHLDVVQTEAARIQDLKGKAQEEAATSAPPVEPPAAPEPPVGGPFNRTGFDALMGIRPGLEPGAEAAPAAPVEPESGPLPPAPPAAEVPTEVTTAPPSPVIPPAVPEATGFEVTKTRKGWSVAGMDFTDKPAAEAFAAKAAAADAAGAPPPDVKPVVRPDSPMGVTQDNVTPESKVEPAHVAPESNRVIPGVKTLDTRLRENKKEREQAVPEVQNQVLDNSGSATETLGVRKPVENISSLPKDILEMSPLEIAREYIKSKSTPDQGSWDASATSNWANTFLVKAVARLEKADGWKTNTDLTPKSRDGKKRISQTNESLQILSDMGYLDKAWDQEGNTHYAKKGTPLPTWLTQEAETTPVLPITPPENVQQTGLDEVGAESQAGREAAGVKEPWQMTREEFKKWMGPQWKEKSGVTEEDWGASGDTARKELIQRALAEGQPVPPEVLADYPDLAAKAGATVKENLTVGRRDYYSKEGNPITIGRDQLNREIENEKKTTGATKRFTSFTVDGVEYLAIEEDRQGWKGGKYYQINDPLGNRVAGFLNTETGQATAINDNVRNRKELIDKFKTRAEDPKNIIRDSYYHETKQTQTPVEAAAPIAPEVTPEEARAAFMKKQGLDNFNFGTSRHVGAPDVGITPEAQVAQGVAVPAGALAAPPVTAKMPKVPLTKEGRISSAKDRGDLRTIIRELGGIKSDSEILKNFPLEERRKLIGLLRKDGFGPDVMADIINKEHPELGGFGQRDQGHPDEDLIRTLTNGDYKKFRNTETVDRQVEDSNDYVAQKASELGISSEEYARVERDAERELAAEEVAGRDEAGPAFNPGEETPFSLKEARERAATFFSQMQTHLADKLPGKGTGADLAKLIEGWGAKGQFKADELKVSGIIPWLQEQKGPVTKQMVLDKLKEGEVRVQVVTKEKDVEPLQWDNHKEGKWETWGSGYYIEQNPDKWYQLYYPEGWSERFRNLADAQNKAEEFHKKNDGTTNTKFQSYLTDLPESFTNRREMLLTVPGKQLGDYKLTLKEDKYGIEVLADGKETDYEIIKNPDGTFTPAKHGGPWDESYPTKEAALKEIEGYYGEGQDLIRDAQVYRVPGAHAYGDPAADVNRFAHMFTADFVEPGDGKKNLVITEVQSDQAREGRSKGYKGQTELPKGYTIKEIVPGKFAVSDPNGKPVPYGMEGLKGTPEEATAAALEELNAGAVPSFPFAKNWHEVALKQAIRYAAENGYDGVMVVNGDMVKQRYDLSKHLDRIEYSEALTENDKPSGTYDVTIYDMQGNLIDTKYEQSPAQLEGFIGKDVTKKIVDGEGKEIKSSVGFQPEGQNITIGRTLSNLDLQVGGEWANNLYDKTIPSYLKKYVKQWGAEVGRKDVEVGKNIAGDFESWLARRWQGVNIAEASQGEIDKMMDEYAKLHPSQTDTAPLTSFDIPQSMRDSVLYKGQPLYSLKDIPPGERLAAFQESPFWKDLSVVEKAKLMFGVKEVVPNIALAEFYRDMQAPGMGSSFTKTGEEAKALHPDGYLDRIQFAMKEDGTLGLASGDRPLSKFEKRLNGITSAYPDADPERVAQALRATPKATDRELAGAASRSQEEASGMARSVTEGQRRAMLAKQSGMKGSALFPEMGMGGGGTLFDQAPEPTRVPAGARVTEPIKEAANAQEGRIGTPDVAGGQPENRVGNLSENAQGRERQLADFVSRRDTGYAGNAEAAWWRGLEPASEAFHESPEAQSVRDLAQEHGIKEVIFVKDAPFNAALPQEVGGYSLVVSESIDRGTHAQQAGHEIAHLKERQGDPRMLRLVESIDTSSEAFKDYRDMLNSRREQLGLPPLEDKAMASEVAADLDNGLTKRRTDGADIDLSQAVRAETALPAPLEKVMGGKDTVRPPTDEFDHLRTAPDETTGKVGDRTLKQETLFSGKEGEENILDLLKVRLEVSRGKLSEAQYNAKYADKYGEWGGQEFRDNVEFLKYSLKEKNQGQLIPGEPVPSFKEFEADLAKDDYARERELRDPANKIIPLYEGETFLGTRGGDFIKDAKGKTVKLTNEDIYERLYNPKTATLPLGTETQKPEKLLGTPEAPGPVGTIEKPPGFGGSVLRALRNEFAAATNSEQARLTKQAITAQTSWARREMAKAMDILDTHYDRFAAMNQEDVQAFTDTVEKNDLPTLRTMAKNGQFEPGLLQAAEEWRRLADGVHLLRANLAEQAAEDAKKTGKPAAEVQTAYWEQYFPRQFEQPPDGAGIHISNYMKGKSLTGPEGFKNARSQLLFSDSIKPKLDTIRNEDGTFSVEKTDLYKGTKEIVETFPDKAAADAMVAEKGGIGLKPLDPNYVNMMKANLFEQFRFVAGKYIQNDLIESGLISRKPEPGHTKFEGDKTLEGYFAHPDVVQVMDNFLSKGIADNILYKIYNTPTTFVNGFLVGFSAFHVTFSSITSMAMGIGQNVGRAIGAAATGNFGVAGHYLAETARSLNLPAQFMLGGKGSEVYKNPDSPFRKILVGEFELGKLIDGLTLGGMENQVTPFKQMLRKLIEPKQAELTQMSRSFSESLTDNLGWPRKIAEAVAWPTMGQVVGRLKLAGMLRTLSMEMSDAKRAGTLADFDITRAAQEIAKKYDNTMGQMVQDNLSMKQIHKNILRLWIGFPGWNIGSFTDILQLGKGIYHTGKNVMGGAKDIAMGRKPTWEKMSRSERMSMEFYGGTVLVMAVFGALAQKLFTGDWPDDKNGMVAFAKDLMMPQTGELMSNGQPERLRLPTYMRDILSLNHPVEMAKHKMNWPIRMFTAMVDNQDFFGTQIRDPYAGVGTQIGQEAKYVGKSLLPFGVQGYLATDAPKARALNLIGITKVPRLYSNTDAMNVIDEYNKQNRATMTSREAEEEKNLKGDLRKLAKAQDEDGFKTTAQDAMEAGTLTRQQIKSIVAESQAPPGLGRFVALPVEWQVRAWAKATDAEKEAWQPYFIKKVMSAKPEILIRNRDILDPTLREMGLDDAADAIQNLKISDKAGAFKLAGLGVRQPTGEMGDIDTVDLAMAKQIAAQEAKLGTETKAKAKKNKYAFLGIQ